MESHEKIFTKATADAFGGSPEGEDQQLNTHRPVIVGVGHCCQDTLCTVERYPPEDGSTHILAIDDSQGGGAVATALVAAARLGATARIMCHLGDDAVGDKILGGFEASHVDTALVRRIPGGRSSTSYVMVDPATGTRTKFPYRDALPPLEFTQAQRAAIAEADALHLDGTQYPNALNAARIAREAGTLVSLDGCSRQPEQALNLALAGMADILIMNAAYPFIVSGQTDRADALRFMAASGRARVVMMTAGQDGVYAWTGSGMRHYPAFPVAAVDTTGAGDVFHGAFLVRYLETRDTSESIRFAQAASALKCAMPGGRAGIPTREALNVFLEAH